jgi:hypothetical protein
MSFSSWIDTRIQNALSDLLPKLATEVAADTSPVVQSIVTGVLDGLQADESVLTNLAAQVTTAVSQAVAAQVENIPQDTTDLMSNELTQLPQQIDDVLNIPAAIAAGVAGLPAQIIQDIKNVIPFAAPAPKKGTKSS